MQKIFKYFVFLILWISANAVYGQVDTTVRSRGVSPPPPPPQPVMDTSIFKEVTDMPRFPGCEHLTTDKARLECANQRLLEFFQKNVIYPAEAKEKKVTGTVILSWVIEKNGQITSPAIVTDIGSGCGEEALRVLNLIKAQNILWTPTSARSRPVRILMNFPVKFTQEMLNRP